MDSRIESGAIMWLRHRTFQATSYNPTPRVSRKKFEGDTKAYNSLLEINRVYREDVWPLIFIQTTAARCHKELGMKQLNKLVETVEALVVSSRGSEDVAQSRSIRETTNGSNADNNMLTEIKWEHHTDRVSGAIPSLEFILGAKFGNTIFKQLLFIVQY